MDLVSLVDRGVLAHAVATPAPSRAVVSFGLVRLVATSHCLHFFDVFIASFVLNFAILKRILNGNMERTLIFKSNMSPISSLRRRSSCYNIQRAEERDRRKSSKFECA